MDKHESFKHLIEWIIFLPVRLKRRSASRFHYRIRSQAIESVRRALHGFSNLKADSHRVVYNVALYLLLLDQDLSDFTDDLINSIGEHRRKYLAKYEATLLYEAAEDLPHLLGRDFRNAVKMLGASEEQQLCLNAASSDLNHFGQSEKEFLGKIRNALAAHREQNALAYIEALDQVIPLHVMRRAADLSAHLNRLSNVITEIAQRSTGTSSLIHDMLETNKQ